jgi:hypothetical protein
MRFQSDASACFLKVPVATPPARRVRACSATSRRLFGLGLVERLSPLQHLPVSFFYKSSQHLSCAHALTIVSSIFPRVLGRNLIS